MPEAVKVVFCNFCNFVCLADFPVYCLNPGLAGCHQSGDLVNKQASCSPRLAFFYPGQVQKLKIKANLFFTDYGNSWRRLAVVGDKCSVMVVRERPV